MQSELTSQERLILALDLPNQDLAKKMVEELGSEVIFYKLGLELMMSGDYFHLIKFLKEKDKKIFADLKLYDIPQTVGKAVKNLSAYEIDFLTIHTASVAIMENAAANKGKIKLLGVTVLTCLDQVDLSQMGFDSSVSIEKLVLKKAEMALKCGLDGVIASPREANFLRQEFGKDFFIITPGIRQNDEQKNAADDQKRTSDVSFAIKSGASHIVVGRPIIAAENPKVAAQNFLKLLDEAIYTTC